MPYVALIGARNQLADVIRQVASAKARLIGTSQGKALAAVVPIKDVKRLAVLKASKAPAGER